VDVDYKELMITKTSIVRETPVLQELIEPKDVLNLDFVMESDQYCGIGCDLRDLQTLDLAMRSLRNLDEALVLCVAEVSVTYMDPDAADALIAWARTLSDGKSGYEIREPHTNKNQTSHFVS
jgi:tRNA wybutosine-synthesizing protein 4